MNLAELGPNIPNCVISGLTVFTTTLGIHEHAMTELHHTTTMVLVLTTFAMPIYMAKTCKTFLQISLESPASEPHNELTDLRAAKEEQKNTALQSTQRDQSLLVVPC